MAREIQSFWRVIGAALVFFALVSLTPRPAQANEAQARIVSAGISLGQATARMELFGKAYGGDPPADQMADIGTNLANAAAEIEAAEALLQEPFRSNREFRGALDTVLRKIKGYENVKRYNYLQKANYIKDIWSTYRQGLMYTYYSGRQDSFQFNTNCDSLLLDVGFHCGRASIASAIQPPHRRSGARASTYQSGANSALRNAINSGLDIALDGRPPQPNPKKIACAFGAPDAWSALPNFQSDSPPQVYYGMCGNRSSTIPSIALNAGLHSVPFGYPVCSSSAGHNKPAACDFAGTWMTRWTKDRESGRNDVKMVLKRNGNFVEGEYYHQGTSSIRGTVNGKVFTGTYTQSSGTGTFTLTLDNCNSWGGTWKDAQGSGSGDWFGDRDS